MYQSLINICTGNLILAAGGLLPGYYFTFLFVDSWGRKPIQLMGFIILTILFVILGMLGTLIHHYTTHVYFLVQDSVTTS